MMRHHPNPVVHLELHTGDMPRAMAFYAYLCGWRPERIDTGSGTYWALDMGNGKGGGIVECGTAKPLWLPYVEVDDIAAITERARRLGASVLVEPREGPAGWRSVVTTPEAGEIAFWQQKERTPMSSADAPGQLGQMNTRREPIR
jgi:predicted enzyme related to lactoylglutathione lyase